MVNSSTCSLLRQVPDALVQVYMVCWDVLDVLRCTVFLLFLLFLLLTAYVG
jgi:hypothetical protein